MLLDKSPYHFWYETMSGLAIPKEETPSMVLGSLFHTLLLEPEKFQKEYAVSPKVDRRTTRGREDYEQFVAYAENKIILTEDQYLKASTMASQIKEHEIVKTLLDDARFEQSIFWTDQETGLQFKTRPDIWSRKMVVDVKTTTDASSHSFMRASLSYGYYLQAAMAFEACKALGEPFEMFVILACEKEAPHVPAVFIMDQDALQYGLNQFQSYKKILKKCMDEDKWPGYAVQELGLPTYATKEAE
jgi:exodeoxyribonuclease VIII